MICPELDELEAYLFHGAPDDSHAGTAEHVQACARCRTRLRELESCGPLEQSVRAYFARSPQADEIPRLGASFGTYQILRELGRGGTGVVYEAQQTEPLRRVALKVLHAAHAVDTRYARLIVREARALARLRHPSIAAIHAAGRAPDGLPYFVMDLIDGEPLTAYAQRTGLSIEDRVRLFGKVCDAVAHAHQRGVVHRDLKPSNILVDCTGQPTVLDFGLARILEPAREPGGSNLHSVVSEIGRVAGTVPYMSPEHVRGRPDEVDVRSDVYSLGIVLYELLTGRRPYALEEGNLARAASVICEQPPLPPGRVHARLRGDLETIVLKALEKRPELRYQSASELAADLRRFLSHQAIVARAPSVWYQFSRFAQRNRMLVGATAVALLAILLGAAISFVQAQVATRQRDAAQRRMEYAQTAANYVYAGVGSQITGVLGTADIQRHLAEEAYVFYRRLAEESPDDPAAQIWLSMSLRRLALQSLDLGDLPRAETLANVARERIAGVRVGPSDDPRVLCERMHLAALLATIAEERGDSEAVVASARQAEQLRVQATRTFEANPVATGSAILAVPQRGPSAGSAPTHLSISNGWADELSGAFGQALIASDPQWAAARFRDALELLDANQVNDPTLEAICRQDVSEYAPGVERILLRNGSLPLYQRARAGLHNGLAQIALQSGDWDAALNHLHVALDLAERERARASTHPATISLLAATDALIARALAAAGEPAAAEYAARARSGYRRLADSDPRNVRWPGELAALP